MKFKLKMVNLLLVLLTLGLLFGNKSTVNAEEIIISPVSSVEYMSYDELLSIQEVKEEIEPIKAWEIDALGNTKEVSPKDSQKDTSLIMPKAPPKDSFRYVFSNYTSSSNSKNIRYNRLGTFTVYNAGNSSVGGQYTQQSSKVTSWTVGTNISSDTSVGNSFLAEVRAKLGMTTTRSKTTSAGTSHGVTFTVPAKKTVEAVAYRYGGKSSGKLVWNKYSSSGSLVGVYTESANGTAVDSNGVHVDVATK